MPSSLPFSRTDGVSCNASQSEVPREKTARCHAKIWLRSKSFGRHRMLRVLVQEDNRSTSHPCVAQAMELRFSLWPIANLLQYGIHCAAPRRIKVPQEIWSGSSERSLHCHHSCRRQVVQPLYNGRRVAKRLLL
mmetsp:Transcript_66385/g.91939  ORF Transcript_66385/g.91939 Transcript_66385/m.91939 type:complete len:134 (-) Transcript_66385:653-1054(-)